MTLSTRGELVTFVDPPAPPEPGETGLRAKDLKNRIVVLRATGTGIDTERLDDAGRPWEWTTCDAWVIDRSGVEQHVSGLRVSWWRVREQLNAAGGNYVAGRVVQGSDNSVTLEAVVGPKREMLTSTMKEIIASVEADEEELEPASPMPDDSEPF